MIIDHSYFDFQSIICYIFRSPGFSLPDSDPWSIWLKHDKYHGCFFLSYFPNYHHPNNPHDHYLDQPHPFAGPGRLQPLCNGRGRVQSQLLLTKIGSFLMMTMMAVMVMTMTRLNMLMMVATMMLTTMMLTMMVMRQPLLNKMLSFLNTVLLMTMMVAWW